MLPSFLTQVDQLLILLGIVAAINGVVSAVVFKRKGHDALTGFVAGAVVGTIGTPLMLIPLWLFTPGKRSKTERELAAIVEMTPAYRARLNRRLAIMAFVLIAISGVLLARLLSFQFYMDPDVKEDLETSAQNRYSRTVEVLPTRGQIYDRNGHLLAANSFEYRIGISPNQVLDRQALATELAPLLNMSAIDIYNRLDRDEDGNFPVYVLLAPRVNFETGQKIIDLELDGMVIESIPTRIYPQGALTAQIVGIFHGSDEKKQGRGFYGVEGFYESMLAGQSTRVTQMTIPVLNEDDSVSRVRDGIGLVLTIDRDLQYLAQDVLNKAMEQPQLFGGMTAGATAGSILIMNPRTGEILAMANYPIYDPNDPEANTFERAKNPIISDAYEPGSVFKVVTMAIALDAGTHDLNWTYTDTNGCFEGGSVLICNWDRIPRGNPDFTQVFVESLNTGTATIFQEMGPSQVYPRVKDFGIGTKTGVDLEGEANGSLVELGDLMWSEAQFLNTSYGQGVAVTPLQMLTAVNAIANDGLIMQPHIVKARIDGNEVIEVRPSPSYDAVSPETANTATDIMIQVLTHPDTEIEFALPGYTVAGKTGTAEIAIPGGYESGTSIASFVAFLPADDPIVSILVKIDRPQGYWGSKVAAPVAQMLLERLVVLMEIPPDAARQDLKDHGGIPFQREYWLDTLDKSRS